AGQAIIGRPQTGCSIFGTDERIRVPSPAAMISTVWPLTFGIVERLGLRRVRAVAPGKLPRTWSAAAAPGQNRATWSTTPTSDAHPCPRKAGWNDCRCGPRLTLLSG